MTRTFDLKRKCFNFMLYFVMICIGLGIMCNVDLIFFSRLSYYRLAIYFVYFRLGVFFKMCTKFELMSIGNGISFWV